MELLLKYNLRSLLVRRITSAVTVAAVGLVVGIVVVILALLRGLQATLLDTGSPDNVIVLRRGAIAEASSAVTQEQYGVLRFLPQVRRDAEGEFLASPELVVQVGLETPDGRRVFGLARGLRARVMAVHDQVQLVSGAWARSPGEAVVGRALARKIGGGVVGTSLRAGRRAWKVAGVFAAGGSGFESELWVDADDLKALYKRSDFSSVTVKLSSAAVAGAFQDAINTDPRLKLTAKPETAYYAEQAEGARRIRALAMALAVLLAVAASFGAMNTMYAAVSHRSHEVATLLALGFSERRVQLCFVAESLAMAVAGGLGGCLGALALGGFSTSVMNLRSFSEVMFQVRVDAVSVAGGLVFAALIGALGGFLPARQAGRMEITTALRQA
ncbi:MAG: multidrug ABC transporter permease [Acidobacteria bacterium]|nr:MAG: multidrug ABC transporter permease [Acidobacteriota bacterium]